MTKEEVNLKVIQELNNKGYDAINMDFNLLNDFADILYQAINYTRCCTEFFCEDEDLDFQTEKCSKQCDGCSFIEKRVAK